KSATVAKAVTLNLGEGADTVRIDGAIGTPTTDKTAPPVLVIEGGKGNDQVFFGGTAKLAGAAKVALGDGDDLFSVAGDAKVATVWVDGGGGKDTFVGSPTRTGFTVLNFEVFA